MCLAVPGQLIDRYHRDGLPLGRVEFAGVQTSVCLSYVPEAQIGDYLLVHVGFAISIVDEREADATRQLIAEMEACADDAASGTDAFAPEGAERDLP